MSEEIVRLSFPSSASKPKSPRAQKQELGKEELTSIDMGDIMKTLETMRTNKIDPKDLPW